MLSQISRLVEASSPLVGSSVKKGAMSDSDEKYEVGKNVRTQEQDGRRCNELHSDVHALALATADSASLFVSDDRVFDLFEPEDLECAVDGGLNPRHSEILRKAQHRRVHQRLANGHGPQHNVLLRNETDCLGQLCQGHVDVVHADDARDLPVRCSFPAEDVQETRFSCESRNVRNAEKRRRKRERATYHNQRDPSQQGRGQRECPPSRWSGFCGP